MNYSYLVLFLLMMITVTFFAPLFIQRGYRNAAESKEDIRQKVFKQMGNKAFAFYALGVLMYIAGLLTCLPLIADTAVRLPQHYSVYGLRSTRPSHLRYSF